MYKNGKGKKYGVDVAQGHYIQADILFIEAEIHAIMQIIGDVGFMRANNAFRAAGGTGGVDEDPGIPDVHLGIGLIIGGVLDEILILAEARLWSRRP